MSMRRFAATVLTLGLSGFANSDPRQLPSDPPPEVVTGTEHLGWEQLTTSADELGRLSYVAYVDGGTRTPLTKAACDPTPGPSGFQCAAPLPALSPGLHILELVALAHYGDVELESPRSRFSIVVSGVASSQSTARALPPQQTGQSRLALTFTTRDGARLAVETYASNLDSLVAMTFTPDGLLFVVERDSQIRIVGKQGALAHPALTLADALDRGEVGGFVDIALHPSFERNHQIYVLYVAQVPGTAPTYRLARFRELNGVLAERAVLLDGIPASSRWDRAAVRFGPDRRLYLGLEDLAARSVAQDLGSLNGKILRLNDDGTIPRDNPLRSPVFSSGHGAPVGLAWHPKTGDLWETERGLNGRDDLNLVTPNTDYGWPDPRLASRNVGQVRVALGASVAPVGATFYTGTLIPAFRNDLFFASEGSRSLYRVQFDAANPQRVVAIESLLEDRFGRLGGVVSGPDGALYIFTSNRAVASDVRLDEDRVLRIVPAS